MAFQLAKSDRTSKTLAPCTFMHVRNAITFKKGKAYGIRLLVSKQGSPGTISCISVITSGSNPSFRSLLSCLGLSEKLSGVSSFDPITKRLLTLDLLQISGIKEKAEIFHSAVSSSDHPGACHLSSLAQSKMKWLIGGVQAVLVEKEPGELARLLSGSTSGETVSMDLLGDYDTGCEAATHPLAPDLSDI